MTKTVTGRTKQWHSPYRTHSVGDNEYRVEGRKNMLELFSSPGLSFAAVGHGLRYLMSAALSGSVRFPCGADKIVAFLQLGNTPQYAG